MNTKLPLFEAEFVMSSICPLCLSQSEEAFVLGIEAASSVLPVIPLDKKRKNKCKMMSLFPFLHFFFQQRARSGGSSRSRRPPEGGLVQGPLLRGHVYAGCGHQHGGAGEPAEVGWREQTNQREAHLAEGEHHTGRSLRRSRQHQRW